MFLSYEFIFSPVHSWFHSFAVLIIYFLNAIDVDGCTSYFSFSSRSTFLFLKLLEDFVPEQFTVKVHPALFEGDEERWAKKWGTVIPVYSWHTLSKRARNIIPV